MNKEEEELERLNQELAELENMDSETLKGLSEYGSPEPEKKDGMFKFFREILHLPESWKVGNLHDTEIGHSNLSVRSLLELAKYSKAEGLDIVSQYFVDRANIVAGTTMGRKGFMPQLFVTNIKKEQKLGQQKAEKSGWFSRGSKNEETE